MSSCPITFFGIRSRSCQNTEADIPFNVSETNRHKKAFRLCAMVTLWFMVWVPSNMLGGGFYFKQQDEILAMANSSSDTNLPFDIKKVENRKMLSYFSNISEQVGPS